jgi:hypothetical protein
MGASRFGKTDAVTFLLEAKANIDVKDKVHLLNTFVFICEFLSTPDLCSTG